MTAKQPSIADAYHVMFGDSAGGSGNVAGFKRLLSLVDPLCPGPCDRNPVRHLRKRRGYFLTHLQEYEGPNARRFRRCESQWTDRLVGAKAFAVLLSRQLKHRSVVLWTTPTLQDRLPFWWILDALQYGDMDRERCWIVDVRFPNRPPAPLGQIRPEAVLAAFSRVEPLSAVNEETGLWQKFASPSPLDFDNARRTSPRLVQICESYGMFFPQAGSRSLLRLSQLDHNLLSTFTSRKWLRPVDLLTRNRSLIEEFFIFGDLQILQRLLAWAKHGRNPALEKRREERAVNEWTAVSFRLTPNGERIRDKGLQSLNEAPPIFVGGCQLNMDAEPWMRRNRGRSWWIERRA